MNKSVFNTLNTGLMITHVSLELGAKLLLKGAEGVANVSGKLYSKHTGDTDPQSIEEYKTIFVAGSRMMQDNAIARGRRIHHQIIARKPDGTTIDVTAKTVHS
jgi:hypothetical protein